MKRDVTAVVWDFDGTLVDTRRKNLNVTRALVELVKQSPADTFEALRSLADYERALQRHQDWQNFYRLELEMSEQELRAAGSRWMEYQIADETLAPPYDGVPDVLRKLADLPQGIVSLNDRDNILRYLDLLELDHYFHEVLGYDCVELERQKPAPDALVLCIERLTDLRAGRVVFVGDHEVDARCAHAANDHFRDEGLDIEVVSVGAFYGGGDDSGWTARPHLRAHAPRDILTALGHTGAAATLG